jgi:succinate-acetate transporter protein
MVNNQFLMHIEFEPMLPFEAWYLIKKKKKEKEKKTHFQFWSHLKKDIAFYLYIYVIYTLLLCYMLMSSEWVLDWKLK